MSKPTARSPKISVSGYQTSAVRCALALLLVVLGIAWIAVYINLAMDAANFIPGVGLKKPDNPLPWMADLKRWNFLIGFGLIFAGLVVSAHPKTPLGRGRAVAPAMVTCLLVGLIWIVVYYFVAADNKIPVMRSLDQYNLAVGIGFIAVGFAFATRWE